MMEGVVYECVDYRRRVKYPLGGLVLVKQIPGGFEVAQHEGYGEQFRFDDDAQLEEVGYVTTFILPEGNVSFVPLTLEDYERLGGSEAFSTPEFQTTQELQDYFRPRIENV